MNGANDSFKSTRIMCHLVAGYPSLEISRAAAEGMVEGGASYLEVQFPFSDPTADGPRIQEACARALEGGFTVEQGFGLTRVLSERYPQVPLFIMSYASLVVRRGIPWFLDRAKESGATGLIVPDLPFDQDEGYFQGAWERGLVPVPVVVPLMARQRLENLLDWVTQRGRGERYLYTALRAGITGDPTILSPESLEFLRYLSSRGFKVLAGFGISSVAQVEALRPHVEAVVVGSYLVGIIRQACDPPRDAPLRPDPDARGEKGLSQRPSSPGEDGRSARRKDPSPLAEGLPEVKKAVSEAVRALIPSF